MTSRIHKQLRLIVAIVLLLLVASSAYAQFDEWADWYWYDGPPELQTSSLVGARQQTCSYAYWWGIETQYEVYQHYLDCHS